jgi:hypothetical protein
MCRMSKNRRTAPHHLPRVIAFNGNSLRNGNTHRGRVVALEEIARKGMETKMVQMGVRGDRPLPGLRGLRSKESWQVEAR